MNKDEEIKAIEELNKEIIESRLMKKKETFPDRISRVLRFFPFRMNEWNHYHNVSKKKKNGDFFYTSLPPVSDKKGVVYSCVTGGYDSVEDPLIKDENLDFLLYTDDKSIYKGNAWTVLDIPLDFKKNGNMNRYMKMHPFEFFKDKYDYTIYIDGNVRIISDVTSLFRVAKDSKCGFAMHEHYRRKCAYDEADVCVYKNKGNAEAIKKQMKRYEKEGFPRDFGLLEATIIVTDLKNNNAKLIFDSWWDEFLASESKRDQLSLPYIMWKKGYLISDVGSLGNNEYLNPKFRIKGHS